MLKTEGENTLLQRLKLNYSKKRIKIVRAQNRLQSDCNQKAKCKKCSHQQKQINNKIL